jgi:hypothetical protein
LADGPKTRGSAGSALSTVGRVISATVGALLLVRGLGSLLDSSDPDASPPRWMETISSISPPGAFGFKMALFPLQVKNLAIFVASLNLIVASSLSTQGSIVALMLVLLVFTIPVLALIGLSATVPQRASTILESLRTWMGKHNRASRSCFASRSEHSSSWEVYGRCKSIGNRGSAAI